MRASLLALLSAVPLCLACGNPPSGASDDAGAPDAEVVTLDITGKFASELSLDVSADYGAANGGVKQSTANVLTAWAALERKGSGLHSIISTWGLCSLPLPGLGDVPFVSLEPYLVQAANGTLAGDSDGAALVQPSISVVIGAVLSHPDTAPLPDGSVLCSDAVATDCVVPDMNTSLPGALVTTTGLSPDIDRAYVVARLRFALSATARSDGKLDGTVTTASLEARVLACHLRGGGLCAAGDVAKINASLPVVKITGGKLRSHAQGFYFVCPQFLGDPAGAISGVELQDGGTGDLTVGGASEPLSFQRDIQPDLDRLGCATGGCHDQFTGPGQMFLYYLPSTETRVRQNYEQALPFTSGGAPGGRLVNQAPLPADVKARWLAWIAQGARY